MNIKPMLCKSDLSRLIKEVNGDMSKLMWQDKLDGVRVLAVLESPDSEVKYYSRTDKLYPNFSIFDEEIKRMLVRPDIKYPLILDGEVISVDKNFQKQMTQIRRLKDADPTIFRYKIFDVVLQDTPLKDRLNFLGYLFPEHFYYIDRLYYEGLDKCMSEASIRYMAELQCYYGHEGIVVKNLDSMYTSGKSHNWVKIKKIETEDLPVIGKEEGVGKHAGRLGALVCQRGDVTVKVGSGYTDKEREEFWQEQPKMVEVQFQSETDGKSLRFPIFKRVRDDK